MDPQVILDDIQLITALASKNTDFSIHAKAEMFETRENVLPEILEEECHNAEGG